MLTKLDQNYALSKVISFAKRPSCTNGFVLLLLYEVVFDVLEIAIKLLKIHNQPH